MQSGIAKLCVLQGLVVLLQLCGIGKLLLLGCNGLVLGKCRIAGCLNVHLLTKRLTLTSQQRLIGSQGSILVLRHRLILHLLGGLELPKVLCNGGIAGSLRFLTHAKLRLQGLVCGLLSGGLLCEVLCRSGVSGGLRLHAHTKLSLQSLITRLLRGYLLCKVLGGGLVSKLPCLQPCAKQGLLGGIAKLACRYALSKVLLLRGILSLLLR